MKSGTRATGGVCVAVLKCMHRDTKRVLGWTVVQFHQHGLQAEPDELNRLRLEYLPREMQRTNACADLTFLMHSVLSDWMCGVCRFGCKSLPGQKQISPSS